jgi:hypothetical protein
MSAHVLSLITSLILAGCGARADLDFDTRVARPAFVAGHPRVLIDEAHHEVHTRDGRFAPFANLIASDGYEVRSNRRRFAAAALEGATILVIANPRGRPNKAAPAFTDEECAVVEAWVAGGGALLLVTDHAPIGLATARLAARFGVDMGGGEVLDPHHHAAGADASNLVFTRKGGLLGGHPILDGRNPSERVDRVTTFTGQSLRGPDGSTPLLPVSDTAVDLPVVKVEFEPGWIDDDLRITFGDPVPATGRSQALAMTHGRGRVVVTGEAAMLTAQVQDGHKFGMNVPGTDNRQLALNIVHWLSRVLP